MNNTKLAGALAAGLIGIPVVAGLIGGEPKPTVPAAGTEQMAKDGETAKSDDAAKAEDTAAAEVETDADTDAGETATTEASGESTETAEAGESTETETTDAAPEAVGEDKSAEAADPTDEGESAETETTAAVTYTAPAPTPPKDTASAEAEATEAETETAAVTYTPPARIAKTDETDEGESAETETTSAVTYTAPARTATEDTAPAETETAAVTYTPPPRTVKTDETDEGESADADDGSNPVTYSPPPRVALVDPSEPKFEDTNGEVAASDTEGEVAPRVPAEEPEEMKTSGEETGIKVTKPTGRVLEGLNGLMSGADYDKAKAALSDAGWKPRELSDADRLDPLDENEQALVDAGYVELEGCETISRTICRFEFLDDSGKIAAILTSGDDAKQVIDGFVMDPN